MAIAAFQVEADSVPAAMRSAEAAASAETLLARPVVGEAAAWAAADSVAVGAVAVAEAAEEADVADNE